MVFEIPFELMSLLFMPIYLAFISLIYYKKSRKFLNNYSSKKIKNNNYLIGLSIYFVLIIIIEYFHLFESLYIFLNIAVRT